MIAEERSASEQSEKKRRFSFLFDDANLRFYQGKTVGYQNLQANWWTEGTNAPTYISSSELQLNRRSRHSLRSFVKYCFPTRKLNSYLRATDVYPLFHLPEIGLQDEVALENLEEDSKAPTIYNGVHYYHYYRCYYFIFSMLSFYSFFIINLA